MRKFFALAALIAPLAVAVPAEAYHHGYRHGGGGYYGGYGHRSYEPSYRGHNGGYGRNYGDYGRGGYGRGGYYGHRRHGW